MPKTKRQPPAPTPLVVVLRKCVVAGCPNSFRPWGRQLTCGGNCSKSLKLGRQRQLRGSKPKRIFTLRKCDADGCPNWFKPRNSRHLTCGPECSKERQLKLRREWKQSPAGKESVRKSQALATKKRSQSPEYKDKKRIWEGTPEAKARARERTRGRLRSPSRKKSEREWQRRRAAAKLLAAVIKLKEKLSEHRSQK